MKKEKKKNPGDVLGEDKVITNILGYMASSRRKTYLFCLALRFWIFLWDY